MMKFFLIFIIFYLAYSLSLGCQLHDFLIFDIVKWFLLIIIHWKSNFMHSLSLVYIVSTCQVIGGFFKIRIKFDLMTWLVNLTVLKFRRNITFVIFTAIIIQMDYCRWNDIGWRGIFKFLSFIMGDSLLVLRLLFLVSSSFPKFVSFSKIIVLLDRGALSMFNSIRQRESIRDTRSTCRGRLAFMRGNWCFIIRLLFGRGEYLRNSQSNLHIALLEYMAFQPSPLVHSASGETMFEVWVISLCTLFLVDSLRVHGWPKILGALKYL